jgi:hypothetical protein
MGFLKRLYLLNEEGNVLEDKERDGGAKHVQYVKEDEVIDVRIITER